MNDRHTVTIHGKRIPHHTAQRDYVCGECGSGLATRWFDDAPHWRTVCCNHPEHPADAFVHRRTIPYVRGQQVAERLIAQDILAHLPVEVQTAIEERRENDAD